MSRFSRPTLTRSRVVNLVIGIALLLVVGMTVRVVTAGDAEDDTDAQTATVDTGQVTASVSASGNVESSSTVNASFAGSGGIVTDIYVKEGQKIHKGQWLARVDQSAAQEGLASARASLAAAQAGYATTTQGQTAAERAQDQQNINASQQSVSSSQVSLSAARSTLALDRRQHKAAVARAERALETAMDARDAAQAAYQRDPTTENQQALSEAQAAVTSARSSLVNARTTKASVLLADQQQVNSQVQAVRAAQIQLSSTRASVAVTQQGPRAGELASAQAQVDSAEVTVRSAQTTLQETVLRAPSSGTVTSINGSVGQSSASTEGASSDSESATSTSGFVTMTAASHLEVTAYVAEADIAAVEVGQTASVTLSANDATYAGEVTGVDTVETITNNVVEYGVTVRLKKARGVKLGQTTQITITTGTKEDVVRVSSSALTTIGNQTTATVRHSDGSEETVPVTTGLEGDSVTEILDGLTPGDIVVLPEQEGSDGGFTFPGGAPGGGPGGGVGGGLGGTP